MGVIVFLVVLALVVAGGFLIAFFWATKDGQFDDTVSPAVRILLDNEKIEKSPRNLTGGPLNKN